MRKKMLVLLSATLVFGVCRADVFPFLTFDNSDGSVVSVDVSSLVMTFSNGKLVINGGGSSQELDVASLDSMYFSSDDLTLVDDMSLDGDNAEKTLYTVAGVKVGVLNGNDSLTDRLSSGLYIVKQGRRTSKIVVK